MLATLPALNFYAVFAFRGRSSRGPRVRISAKVRRIRTFRGAFSRYGVTKSAPSAVRILAKNGPKTKISAPSTRGGWVSGGLENPIYTP